MDEERNAEAGDAVELERVAESRQDEAERGSESGESSESAVGAVSADASDGGSVDAGVEGASDKTAETSVDASAAGAVAAGAVAAKDPDDDLPSVDDPEDEIDPSTLEKCWYILKVQVNRESSVCDTLKRRIQQFGLHSYFGEMLIPTEDVREYTKAGKQKIVKRKLYPGYIMINMAITEDSWWLVRDTPGIGDFSSSGGKPTPLGEDDIQRILKAARPPEIEAGAEQEVIKTAIKHKIGDHVRVKDGNFENFEGDISAIDERNGRVTVLINIFGRLNPVEMDHWQVEAM